LPAGLQLLAIGQQRGGSQTARSMPLEGAIAWSLRRTNQPAHSHAAHAEIEGDAPDGLAGRVSRANSVPAGDPPSAGFDSSCFVRLNCQMSIAHLHSY
jgi:hypothetical protein